MRDVIIIGGGIASMSAAIYLGRQKLDTLILASEPGGQISQQPEVWNYAGFLERDGAKLIANARKQVEDLGIKIEEGTHIQNIKIEQRDGQDVFLFHDGNGFNYESKSLIVASGKKPRTLNIPGETEYMNKGVTYCAVCDAPLFGGKDVAVIGGGNTGLDWANLLAKYADKVYVLVRSDIRGAAITYEKLKSNPKVEFLMDVEPMKITGNSFVDGVVYKNRQTGEEKTLPVQGVFPAIGLVPNTDFCKDLVEIDQWGQVTIDPRTGATSRKGVFAAGDVTDVLEKQAIIAAGQGAMAALSAIKFVEGKE